MTTVITFGTFDLLHIGHVRILQRARLLGDKLIVGVSSDALNFKKKKRRAMYTESERLEIVGSLECVNDVFLEESLEQKKQYIEEYEADILVMGDDWKGNFDHLKEICRVAYLPRTPNISTSLIVGKIC